jgi:spore maturation protein CgeB
MKVILFGIDNIFADDICWGFQSLGHEVLVKFPSSIKEFDQLIADFRPEMIMTFGSPSYYQDSNLLEYIGKRHSNMNTTFVHWDTDGITWVNLEINMIQLLKPDIVFTVCPDMLEVLKQKNIICDMLPYAFSPQTHYPSPYNTEYAGMTTFIGCAYPEVVCNPQHYRTKSIETLIKPLLQNGSRVDFWGDTRHQYVLSQNFNCVLPDEWSHGRCLYQKTNEIYNSCFINVVPQNHEHHLTKRTYEILGSGGFILTYDTAGIRKLFTPQKELVVSSSPKQTLELVEYYRNNQIAYDEIRKNAVISAQNHTYKQRAEYIIRRIEGKGTLMYD